MNTKYTKDNLMNANTKPSGFIKRMLGASATLFMASALLVSCDGLEGVLPIPSEEDSKECYNAKTQMLSITTSLAAYRSELKGEGITAERKAQLEDYVSQLQVQQGELRKNMDKMNCK